MAFVKDNRSYIAAHFALVVDGQPLFLKKIEGGAAKADIITEPAGPHSYTIKHIGQPKYDELTATMGISISKALHEWIKASWDKAYFRKDGSIVACDFNYQPITARNFTQALITETTYPACDAKGKEPAYMTIKIKPEIIRWVKGGEAPKISGKPDGQKSWIPSNFVLEIKGYEDDLKRVSKVDALTVKQSAVEDAAGAERDSQFNPGKLEMPDCTFTIPESHADKLQDYFYDFVILGHCTPDKELGGALHYTSKASTAKSMDALMTINFQNMGVCEMTPDAMEAGSESIKNVKFKFYSEAITVEPDKLMKTF